MNTERHQRILKHLTFSCNNSTFGEVALAELIVPTKIKPLSLSSAQQQAFKEAILCYGGLITPTIVRPYASKEALYEVIYGGEQVIFLQEWMSQLGKKEARKLKIDKLRVWSFEVTDEELANFLIQVHWLTSLSQPQISDLLNLLHDLLKLNKTQLLQRLDKLNIPTLSGISKVEIIEKLLWVETGEKEVSLD